MLIWLKLQVAPLSQLLHYHHPSRVFVFFRVTSQYPHLLLHIPLWAIPPYPIHLQYCRKTVTTLCMWWLEHITVWLWHIPLSRVVIWVFFLSSYGFSSAKWDVCHWSWIFTNFWEASIQTQKGAICWACWPRFWEPKRLGGRIPNFNTLMVTFWSLLPRRKFL